MCKELGSGKLLLLAGNVGHGGVHIFIYVYVCICEKDRNTLHSPFTCQILTEHDIYIDI